MKALVGVLMGLALLGAGPAWGQASPVAGRWQGLMRVGEEDLRIVVRLEERAPGTWSCAVNVVQRGADAMRCATFSTDGRAVAWATSEAQARFAGALSDDGAAIEGTWTSVTGARPVRFVRAGEADAWPTDAAAHKEILVTASDGTRLEVLDFGGVGPALIFVPGMGTTGHVFDAFAPRFTDTHRVYAVTRRGFGFSDRPEASAAAYGSRRLGDDVVEVMDALKIERAALVGWSLGGMELSSVATRRPERVTGAVYLDGAYAYAFYARGNMVPLGSNLEIATGDLLAKIEAAEDAAPDKAAAAWDGVLTGAVADLSADIAAMRDRWRIYEAAAVAAEPAAPAAAAGPAPAAAAPAAPSPPPPGFQAAAEAISANIEKVGAVKVPVLAIFANRPAATTGSALAQLTARINAQHKREQIDRYKAAHPQAKVVELSDADHAVFRSNTEQVAAEMRTFLAGLPR